MNLSDQIKREVEKQTNKEQLSGVCFCKFQEREFKVVVRHGKARVSEIINK
jgi:hypothetical protein